MKLCHERLKEAQALVRRQREDSALKLPQAGYHCVVDSPYRDALYELQEAILPKELDKR